MSAIGDNGDTERIPVHLHPLLTKELKGIETWEEWLDLWNRNTSFEGAVGLLHYCPLDRGASSAAVCFCLDVAYGFTAASELRNPGDHMLRQNYPIYSMLFKDRIEFLEARRLVAKKAWEVLCNKFFHNTSKNSRCPSWWDNVKKIEVLQKVLWFFRVAPSRGSSFESSLFHYLNYRRADDHYAKVSYDFLSELLALAWTYDKEHMINRAGDKWRQSESDEQIKETKWAFSFLQPELLLITEKLDLLSLLLEDDAKVNKETMRFLKKMALETPNEKGKGGEDRERNCRSIEEAVWNGSRAATIYLLLAVKQEEQRTHEKRRRALAERAAADQKLKGLTS